MKNARLQIWLGDDGSGWRFMRLGNRARPPARPELGLNAETTPEGLSFDNSGVHIKTIILIMYVNTEKDDGLEAWGVGFCGWI